MQPAFSVIWLTTLIGTGQGLLLALYSAQLAGAGEGQARLFALGGALALLFSAAGLFASFFHLGRPERAWRAAAMWRTSWLSREVIILPLFMAAVAGWTAAWIWRPEWSLWAGALAALSAVALFVCTAMIYASVRFIAEWASALTVVNYLLLGCASGATAAAALAAVQASPLARPLAWAAMALTLAGLGSRGASLWRNARLTPRSTLQSAIGIKHPRITQRSQGFMGGSFNTREFFHGASAGRLRQVKWWFLTLGFVAPLAALTIALAPGGQHWAAIAFALQFAGLVAERWFFFAQANHPQNLYYQTVS